MQDGECTGTCNNAAKPLLCPDFKNPGFLECVDPETDNFNCSQ